MPIELKVQPPPEAVAAFEGRGLLITGSWQSLWHQEHAQAFTVANLARLDLLQEIHSALDQAIKDGVPYKAFEKGLVPKLQAAGWWNQAVAEGKPLTPSRLRLIYDVNLRVSYAASQWARIQRLKKRMPYLRYSTMKDRRVRNQHRLWEGITLLVDHTWWQTHYPPNGWRCRCDVAQLSLSDLDAAGGSVTPDEALPKGERTFVNKMTGEVTKVPAGIDPGWAYNPGESRNANLLNMARQKLEVAEPSAAHATLQGLVSSPAFDGWAAKPEGLFPVLRVPVGIQAAIQAETPIAVLSPATMAKQAVSHPDLVLDDYRRLPWLGEAPDLVVQDGDSTLVLVKREGKLWLAALKAARGGGRELFVTSFRASSEADAQRKVRGGTVLLDSGRWRG